MGSRAKGRVQRERRLVDMSVPLPVLDDEWSPPDPNDVDEWPFHLPLHGLGQIVGRQGLHRETGRLVEFAMIAQVVSDGRWRDIAVVDTCHNEVHFHQMSHTGQRIARRVILLIRSLRDVDRGWDEGEKILTERWDEHLRRWRRGR
jgi:hypothetical protein